MSRLVWGFTTRNGGISEGPYRSLNLSAAVGDDPSRVAENRRRAVRLLGLPEHVPVAVAAQEHGARVLVVDGLPVGGSAVQPGGWHVVGQGDALLTGRPHQVLAVLVADCAPVLLADEESGWIGAVHAGWRGLAAGVVEAAVEQLVSRSGASRGRVRAYVGPSIRACCYEVGPEVAAAVEDGVEQRDGRFFVDLPQAALARLQRAGLVVDRIEVDGRCTACHAEEFFSYRRDGRPGGRMAGLVARVEG